MLRLVADAPDLAVRHVPDGAVDRAEPRGPQADYLDDPDRLTEVDSVANAELILDEDEDAGQEVLDQALRAEADRDADDARARQHRAEVDPDLIEDEEDGHRPYDEA